MSTTELRQSQAKGAETQLERLSSALTQLGIEHKAWLSKTRIELSIYKTSLPVLSYASQAVRTSLPGVVKNIQAKLSKETSE